MLFRRHNGARIRCRFNNDIFIDRLDGAHVDDTCRDAGALQDISRLQCFAHHDPAGNNRNIISLAKNRCLARNEGRIFSGNIITFSTSHPDIHRSLIGCRPFDGCFCFFCISRHNDSHIRKHPHQGNVFQHLMRCTIFPYRQSCMRKGNLYVELWIADGIPNLFIRTAGTEDRKCGSKRNLSCRSKACRHTHHISFGNTAVKETFRIYLGKILSLCGCRQIRIENNEIRINRTQLF